MTQKHWPGKLGEYVLHLGLAVLASGLFGALHDQISYSVSSEYFTLFKFYQFDLLDGRLPERWRVANVGFRASWWMGIPLGLLTGLPGFMQPTAKQMRRALLQTIVLIMSFTLSVALLGLGYGYLQTINYHIADYQGWFIPAGLQQTRQYLCVGYMHEAAYLGGLLAIPVAWLYQFWLLAREGGEKAQKRYRRLLKGLMGLAVIGVSLSLWGKQLYQVINPTHAEIMRQTEIKKRQASQLETLIAGISPGTDKNQILGVLHTQGFEFNEQNVQTLKPAEFKLLASGYKLEQVGSYIRVGVRQIQVDFLFVRSLEYRLFFDKQGKLLSIKTSDWLSGP